MYSDLNLGFSASPTHHNLLSARPSFSILLQTKCVKQENKKEKTWQKGEICVDRLSQSSRHTVRQSMDPFASLLTSPLPQPLSLQLASTTDTCSGLTLGNLAGAWAGLGVLADAAASGSQRTGQREKEPGLQTVTATDSKTEQGRRRPGVTEVADVVGAQQWTASGDWAQRAGLLVLGLPLRLQVDLLGYSSRVQLAYRP